MRVGFLLFMLLAAVGHAATETEEALKSALSLLRDRTAQLEGAPWPWHCPRKNGRTLWHT